MTAPLYLLDPGALDALASAGSVGSVESARLAGSVQSPGVLVLDGPEGRHAATVRRTRVGERVDVADGAGRVARCVVTAVGAGRLELAVQTVETVPTRWPRLLLVQALAKGGRDESAVETATELGVDAVIPWQATRSVVVWSGDRGRRARDRWQAIALAAAKQSRRASVPEVEPLLTTSALADRVARLVGEGAVVLVLHEAADEPLAQVELPEPNGPDGARPNGPTGPTGAGGDLLVIVGPEGGVAQEELDLLARAGARMVRLGPEVLRTSSAGPAALAVLSVRLGRWP